MPPASMDRAAPLRQSAPMAGKRLTERPDETRRSAVWAVLAVFLVNLLFGSFPHLAASLPDLAGAIAICAADGGTRTILPDGSTVPQPGHPMQSGPGCPDCITCTPACGIGCGLAASVAGLAPQIDPTRIDLQLRAASAFTPRQSFPLRPPGQTPPLKLA
jgi:hypothetical protein